MRLHSRPVSWLSPCLGSESVVFIIQYNAASGPRRSTGLMSARLTHSTRLTVGLRKGVAPVEPKRPASQRRVLHKHPGPLSYGVKQDIKITE